MFNCINHIKNFFLFTLFEGFVRSFPVSLSIGSDFTPPLRLVDGWHGGGTSVLSSVKHRVL